MRAKRHRPPIEQSQHKSNLYFSIESLRLTQKDDVTERVFSKCSHALPAAHYWGTGEVQVRNYLKFCRRGKIIVTCYCT